MRVLVAFDGSDDGYDALRLLVGQFADRPREIAFVIVTWPERESPIWDKAFAHQIDVDDLHRSMADVAACELRRLRALFAHPAAEEPLALTGDPLDELLRVSESHVPDLVLMGITRGRHHTAIHRTVDAFLARTPYPVVVAYGTANAVERSR